MTDEIQISPELTELERAVLETAIRGIPGARNWKRSLMRR